MPATTIKVFVSSPSDLSNERQVAGRVCEKLNRNPFLEDRVVLRPYLYEERTPSLVGTSAQKVVDDYMLRAEDADIVLCMFWCRLGTPFVDQDSGREYLSGTVYEFERAYEHTSTPGNDLPLVLLYRCRRRPPYDLDVEQFQKVKAFFDRFRGDEADLEGMLGTFEEDFEGQLEDDLGRLVARWLPAAKASGPRPAVDLDLRSWPRARDLPLPERPYPVLSPYDHPRLFFGRRDDLALAREQLGDRRRPILTLFATSGAGKSSLLQAGVVPEERDAGRAVAYVDRPEDSSLAESLVQQLLEVPDSMTIEDPLSSEAALEDFLQYIRCARTRSSGPPLLILDQFEHLFRHEADQRAGRSELEARARVGLLLAASLRAASPRASSPAAGGSCAIATTTTAGRSAGSRMRWSTRTGCRYRRSFVCEEISGTGAGRCRFRSSVHRSRGRLGLSTRSAPAPASSKRSSRPSTSRMKLAMRSFPTASLKEMPRGSSTDPIRSGTS